MRARVYFCGLFCEWLQADIRGVSFCHLVSDLLLFLSKIHLKNQVEGEIKNALL